jgi:hypothetical protein
MKSLTKNLCSTMHATAAPVLCLAIAVSIADQKNQIKGIRLPSVSSHRRIRVRTIETIAQADPSPGPAAASSPRAAIVYGGMHNIAKENGGFRPWPKSIPGRPQPAIILHSASAPPVDDGYPAEYPNTYPPPPVMGQPNPYRQGIQPAPLSNRSSFPCDQQYP